MGRVFSESVLRISGAITYFTMKSSEIKYGLWVV